MSVRLVAHIFNECKTRYVRFSEITTVCVCVVKRAEGTETVPLDIMYKREIYVKN